MRFAALRYRRKKMGLIKAEFPKGDFTSGFSVTHTIEVWSTTSTRSALDGYWFTNAEILEAISAF